MTPPPPLAPNTDIPGHARYWLDDHRYCILSKIHILINTFGLCFLQLCGKVPERSDGVCTNITHWIGFICFLWFIGNKIMHCTFTHRALPNNNIHTTIVWKSKDRIVNLTKTKRSKMSKTTDRIFPGGKLCIRYH